MCLIDLLQIYEKNQSSWHISENNSKLIGHQLRRSSSKYIGVTFIS